MRTNHTFTYRQRTDNTGLDDIKQTWPLTSEEVTSQNTLGAGVFTPLGQLGTFRETYPSPSDSNSPGLSVLFPKKC